MSVCPFALAMMEHRGSKKKQDLPTDAIMLLKINTIDDDNDDNTVEDAEDPAEEPVVLPAKIGWIPLPRFLILDPSNN